MRITNRMASDRVTSDINRSLGELLRVQEQLSTTKRVNKPSDDPFATHRAISARTRVAFLEQYRVNVRETSAWASLTDVALGGVGDILQEARTAALGAVNGTLTPAARENIASVVDQLRETAFQLSGEKYAGRYLFSGSKTSDVPFTWTGTDAVYNGNAAHMSRNIAPGASMSANITGEEAFGPGGANVFKTLYDLAQSIRAGDVPQVEAAIGDVDGFIDQVVGKRGEVGAAVNRLEMTESLLAMYSETETSLLSDAEDLDLAQGVMELKVKENAYQATLAAASRVILPSLIDYMK